MSFIRICPGVWDAGLREWQTATYGRLDQAIVGWTLTSKIILIISLGQKGTGLYLWLPEEQQPSNSLVRLEGVLWGNSDDMRKKP